MHLQSLVWGLKETLDKISPFPIGLTKEECIASEVRFQKKLNN